MFTQIKNADSGNVSENKYSAVFLKQNHLVPGKGIEGAVRGLEGIHLADSVH
jgi:hypothetical protein